MERDAILSLSTAGRTSPHATVLPSPVLDLIYACFHLRARPRGRGDEAPWAEELRRGDPELVREVVALGALGDDAMAGRVLFAVALEYGYVADADVARFIDDLPDRAEQLAARLEPRATGDDEDAARMAAWLRDPPDPEWATRAQGALQRLARALAPVWYARARAAAEAAAASFEAQLREHGDVLRALPPHHFAQFEAYAPKLRAARERGRLWIVPLAFATSGGFLLEAEGTTALGFGLLGEEVHESTERRVAGAARSAKAFADPTRLMLLSLVARFESMSLTVGDLARQLGVSQPTVSGHLKALREAGLVRTERQGNRTIARLERDAVRAALAELAAVLE